VELHPFKAYCHWLEFVHHPKYGVTCIDFSKVSPSVREFKLVDVVDFNEINVFSHSMPIEKNSLKNHVNIHPKIGRVWAMYKMIPLSKSKAQNELQYEMVEIKIDFSIEIEEVNIMSLVKLYNLKKHLEGSWICDLGR
jgi:hypothetical protein